MAVAAVLLKLTMVMNETVRPGNLPYAELFRALGAVVVVVQSTSIVGLGTLLLSLARGSRGRLEPGHWMVLIDSSVFCIWMLFSAASLLMILGNQRERASDAYWSVNLAITLLQVVIYRRVATSLTGTRRWPRYFLALAVVAALRALLLMPGMLLLLSSPFTGYRLLGLGRSPLWVLTELVVLLPPVVLDLRCRAQRDWLHWVGVVAHALVALCSLLNWSLVNWSRPRLLDG